MAERSGFVQALIPKFDGYYEHWAMFMEILLLSEEYWGLIENGIATTMIDDASADQLKAVEDGKLKDLKAKNYLFEAIEV